MRRKRCRNWRMLIKVWEDSILPLLLKDPEKVREWTEKWTNTHKPRVSQSVERLSSLLPLRRVERGKEKVKDGEKRRRRKKIQIQSRWPP